MFIQTVECAFDRRRKAISYLSNLEILKDTEGECESLIVFHKPLGSRPSVELQVFDDCRISIAIKSTRKKDRGKKLFSLNNNFVPGNEHRLVEGFEQTVSAAFGLQDDGRTSVDGIRKIWNEICLSVL